MKYSIMLMLMEHYRIIHKIMTVYSSQKHINFFNFIFIFSTLKRKLSVSQKQKQQVMWILHVSNLSNIPLFAKPTTCFWGVGIFCFALPSLSTYHAQIPTHIIDGFNNPSWASLLGPLWGSAHQILY